MFKTNIEQIVILMCTPDCFFQRFIINGKEFREYKWKWLEIAPMSDNTRFGFVNFAETWNGRLAMLGFVIGLGTELLTGQGILSQIGLG